MISATFTYIIFCLGTLSRASTVTDTHYVGAVVEYNAGSTTDVNLENYVDFIKQAADQEADIVAFPEMTLLRGGDAVEIPIHGLLKEHPIPAVSPDLYHRVLVQLSQAARDNHIYVVVNIQEQLNCSSPQPEDEVCPDREVIRFNTNVVFDRKGSVIDRYRKINLFGEYSRSPSLDDQLGVFTTDFGVTFGHFICFDLMFQVPAIQLVQKYNITDVVFTTMWFSEMPFLTALEIQQAYAYANNVNFLASGANRVEVGSAGSGIYSGKAGALISTMPGVETRRLLVSSIPKVPGRVDGMTYPGAIPNDPHVLDSLLLKRDLSLPSHVSRVIEQTEHLQEFQLSDGTVTCSFRIQLRDLNRTGNVEFFRYRTFAQDGVVTYANRVAGISACVVVACVNDDVTSCAERSLNTTSKYEFTTLQITQKALKPKYNETLKCNDAVFYTTTLKNDKFPLEPASFKFEATAPKIYHKDNEHKIQNTLELVIPQVDLLTFGLWGRIFERDVNRRHETTEATKEKFQAFEDNSIL